MANGLQMPGQRPAPGWLLAGIGRFWLPLASYGWPTFRAIAQFVLDQLNWLSEPAKKEYGDFIQMIKPMKWEELQLQVRHFRLTRVRPNKPSVTLEVNFLPNSACYLTFHKYIMPALLSIQGVHHLPNMKSPSKMEQALQNHLEGKSVIFVDSEE